MIELQKIFDFKYGNSLDLNKLKKVTKGINFISRTAKNNGVSAIVASLENIEKMPTGSITVSLGGSVLEAFLQPSEYYTGYHIYCLTVKDGLELTDLEKLYYCSCIRANKFKYSYGRQANRTLKNILVPAPENLPKWIDSSNLEIFRNASAPLFNNKIPKLNIDKWEVFSYEQLFEIERGRGPRKKDLDGTGKTPFITSTDSNNGLTNFTSMDAIHEGNTIGVNRNGSVAEAFYQLIPFCSTEDVHIFKPKFELNQYIAMFLITLIRKEKYRYSYGRKWGIERMRKSTISLPADGNGDPDWLFMESYIKSLQFSSKI